MSVSPFPFVKLFLRPLSFGEVQAHGVQDAWRFGKLEIAVFNNFDTVTPWIEEIEKVSAQQFRARFFNEGADMVCVIDHQPKMPIAVRALMSTTAQRDELIAHIDKRHHDMTRVVLMAASKVERENAP